MKLVVISSKACWSSANSKSGFATEGGFPFQMQALSELFDTTRILVPVQDRIAIKGEIPMSGHNFTVVPLTGRSGRGFISKLSFLPWLLRNAATIIRELRSADAVHAPIPGDIGTVGMILARMFRKPLFVRHCGNWLKPVTRAERFWRWFMETTAGDQNVMLATGGTAEPPSQKNSSVKWVFSSSLTRRELETAGIPRTLPADGQVKLIIAARQERAKGAGRVIEALPRLGQKYPRITFEVLGDGSALPEFGRLAAELNVQERVTFTGLLNHDEVLARLREAHLFVFPTTSSDGFPKAVLEGLASGLPVVATRVSVLPQLLGNGSGVLLDEATPEAVAHGIEHALRDSANYKAMSILAIETARQYSLEAWRDTIGQYLTAAWGPLKK